MLDTIILTSPFLDRNTFNKLLQKSSVKQHFNIATNEVYYEFTNADLKGSFDNRISIKLKETKFEYIYDERKDKSVTQCVSCEPYIQVELSIHKFFVGHNVFNGFDDFYKIGLFVVFLQKYFGVKLPYYLKWYVEKIDYTRAFNLESKENCLSYINSLKMISFPRRKVARWDTSISVPGYSTTLKIYHKGSEFEKHDFKRLKNCWKYGKVFDVLVKADKIVRFEMSVKKRKLQKDFDKKEIRVKDLYIDYFSDLWQTEFRKLLGCDVNMLLYLRKDDILKHLINLYGERKGKNVFATYVTLLNFGDKYTRNIMKSSAYYDHMKILRDNNIDYKRGEFIFKFDTVFSSFSPFGSSREVI